MTVQVCDIQAASRNWQKLLLPTPSHAQKHTHTHTIQKVYKIKTSLLRRGRDGDTMMSSESSESTAAAPVDSAVQQSSARSAGDTQVRLCLITMTPFTNKLNSFKDIIIL